MTGNDAQRPLFFRALLTLSPGFGRKMYTDYEIVCKVHLAVFGISEFSPLTPPLDQHSRVQIAALARAPALFRL